ncbi:MAG: gliding motility-associated C-terminal domain-containing protein [Bacteroidota bacterium]
MNRTLFRRGERLLLVVASLYFLSGLRAAGADMPPPTFIDPVPNDTMVGCYEDRPAVLLLTAQTDAGMVTVNPRDSLAGGLPTICSGGILFRIWEVSDTEGSARVEQQITFGPATDGPTIDPGIDLTPDTVECTRVNQSSDPLSYSSWLAAKQLAVIAAARPGCAPIVNITDNGPPNLLGADCNDSVTVTFTVLDQCNRTVSVDFRYVVEDNTPPDISGDTLDVTLTCGDAVPAVPNLIISDCNPDPVVVFSEINGQTSNGSCSDYEYEILRSWTATDSCGNTTIATQSIFFVDDEQPTFNRPGNIELVCTQDWQDTTLTGSITNLADNCTPINELTISFSDLRIDQPDCNFNFNVRRTWTVTDICGNTNSQVQNIFVGDNEPPTFTPPADTMVNCEDLFNFSAVGEPTELMDACTENPNLSFEDNIVETTCANSFRLERVWRIFDDCGNDEFYTQQILVSDTMAPVFVTPPTDLITTCNNEQNQDELFNLWIIDLAGGRAVDNCSPSDSISYQVFVSGTQEQPLLPPFDCSIGEQSVRKMDVDVIATDQCGNSRTVTVTFRQIDTQAPEIIACPQSSVVSTGDVCGATVAFVPPTVQDECVTGLPDSHRTRDTVAISSAATDSMTLGSTPVNTVVLSFPIFAPQPVNALLPSELTITLENVDAEGAEEYFLIYGEDGVLLDTTRRSEEQCGNSVTIIELSEDQFDQWAVDGQIQITLEPNIPADESGTFAINDLCTGESRVLGYLRTPIRRLSPITFEIFIDDDPAIEVDPYGTYIGTVEPGFHQVTYRMTDCAGNSDECSHTITVEDVTAPEVTCPDDIVISLFTDSCAVSFGVPLPLAANDNCGIYDNQTIIAPSEAERFFTFDFDPNLNTYQANDIVVDLPPIPSYTFDTAVIVLRFRGDFSSNNATLDLVTNTGQVLGTTAVGDADCDNEGSLTIRIPADEFNDLVNSINFDLVLRPRQIFVPPGQSGDGVNPCDPSAVTQDGQGDGQSYAYVEINYQLLRSDYFTTGITNTPRTSLTEENPFPQISFARGTTDFFYIVEDPVGNTDSCSFSVTVQDIIPPVVTCEPTTVFLDPSGQAPVTIDPTSINSAVSDNCTIDTIMLSPTTFECDLIGTNQQVTLIARDEAGNEGSCTTTVGITGAAPLPTAISSFCGGDSLFLFANPPVSANPGQTLYTYAWFNPANVLVSTEENPVLPSVDADDDGPYRVEITGITGCTAVGVINIDIQDLPMTPGLTAPAAVCVGDAIPLAATMSSFGNFTFDWYEGSPDSGSLISSTTVPNFMAPASDSTENRSFYLVVRSNGCSSAPAIPITIATVEKPVLNISQDNTSLCEQSSLNLSTELIPGVAYSWRGPAGFTATGPTIGFTDLVPFQSGTYYLDGVLDEGCIAVTDSVELTVLPLAPTPSLSSNGPVCFGDELVITASNDSAVAYTFFGPNGFEMTADTGVLQISTADFSDQGQWSLLVNNGDCPSLMSATLEVQINTLPTAQTMILPDPVCVGNDVVLQGSSNVNGSNYAWTGPNDFTSDNIAPVVETLTGNEVGNYVLTVTAPNGCTDTDTLLLDILPGIEVTGIEIVDETCFTGGETVALIATIAEMDSSLSYTYEWSGPMGAVATTDTLSIPEVSPMNSGSYAVTVSNSNGCVSTPAVFTVDLQFAPATPIPPFTLDGEIGYCVGSDFSIATTDYGPGSLYFWQLPGGSVITSDTNMIDLNAFGEEFAGNYRVRVVRDGCTSPFSDPREIFVTNFPNMAISANSPVCAGEAIMFQVTDLAGATYSWRGPNNFSSSLANPTIGTANALLHNGEYRVVAAIGGCVSDTLSIDVAVLPKPSVPVGVPTMPICISDEDALLSLDVNENTATDGARYQWFIDNGAVPIAEPSTDLELQLDDFSLFPAGGVVSFYVQAELNGCLSDLSNPIEVRLDVVLDDAADAGSDTTVCEGLHLLVAEQPAIGTGAWTMISGGGDIFIANPNSATTAVSGMTEFGGPYTFEWSLSNGTCEDYSRDTIRIDVTSGEEAFAGADILACLNTEVTLGATAVIELTSQGEWSQNQAQEILGVVIVEPNNPNTVITGLQPDNVYSFTWTVTSTCGIKTDVVLVNVSDPAPDAGMDDIVCNEDGRTVLAASEATIGSSGSWRAIDPDLVIDDPDSPTTMVGNLAVGDNLFIWEVDGGTCGVGSTDTVNISYKEPALPVDDDVLVPFQGSMTFNPLENDIIPVGTSLTFPEAPAVGSLENLGDGSYRYTAPPNFVGELNLVYLLLSDGCAAASGTVNISIGNDADCAAPNIFTPNNDGVNDFFVIPCLLDLDAFQDSEVSIFNQWGDEVYRSDRPYRGDWDGRFNGEDLPVGTYFYIIEFGGERPSASGHVRIQR